MSKSYRWRGWSWFLSRYTRELVIMTLGFYVFWFWFYFSFVVSNSSNSMSRASLSPFLFSSVVGFALLGLQWPPDWIKAKGLDPVVCDLWERWGCFVFVFNCPLSRLVLRSDLEVGKSTKWTAMMMMIWRLSHTLSFSLPLSFYKQVAGVCKVLSCE